MGRMLKKFAITVIIIILLLAGALWWLLSYIAPDEKLDMSYAPIDVKEKALDMVKKLKPELVLTESDINHLIKMNMQKEELAKDIRLDGALFELEEDRLVAHMNVTYKERIPAELNAVYSLEWQPPNIALRPQSLSLKEMALPVSMLDAIIIPLDLPGQDIVTVKDVEFLKDQIKVLFKLGIQLQL